MIVHRLEMDRRVAVSTAADASRKVLGQKRKLTAVPDESESPAAYVLSHFKANGFLETDSKGALKFLKPTEEMIAAYKMETIDAVRKEDIVQLRRLYDSGETLQCCNRFGESLIHMACRRGYTDMVRFLVQEAKVSLLVRDDYGRTPLHDACWTAKPRFDLVDFIVSEVPELLCIKDVRGHTPLNYVRKEDWDDWRSFFTRRRGLLRAKSCPSFIA